MVDTTILCKIARQAGEIIMEVYQQPDFQEELKSDDSPVTIADKRADEFIRSELHKIHADIPVLSEESEVPSYEIRKKWSECFIVDPLDGTKEFLKRNDEFTVNIAYVKNGKTVEGVVYAPAKDLMYFTRDGKSYKGEELLPVAQTRNNFRIVTSRSHINTETQLVIDEKRKLYPDLETIRVGSSLKLCLIAEGNADFYPRLGPTSEWDIAAAQAVVEQAGGSVISLKTSNPLTYNKENILNDWFEVRRRQ